MCGVGVCNILLLPLVARCIETIDVCIWRMFVFMSVVVIVWGLWECLLCSTDVKYSVFFSLAVLKYVVCLFKGCDGCCVFVCIVMRGAVGTRVWEVCVFRHAAVVCLCLCTSCGSSQC